MADQAAQQQTPLWEHIDKRLRRLAGEQALGDYEQGRWLLKALRHGVYAHFGHASMTEYAEHLFGYSPRQTGERLRVAEALEDLPALRDALQGGTLCWSAVRELSRVAIGTTEQAWLEAAAGRTARDVESMVAGRRPGDRPDDPADPAIRKRRLWFEVEPETLAAFREAVDVLRWRTGEHLSQEEALLLMARAVCGGPANEGRSNYQVALTVCERCGQGFQQASGELVAVRPEVVEMARCDAQHIGRVDRWDGAVGGAKRDEAATPESPSTVTGAAPDEVDLPHVGAGATTDEGDAPHMGTGTTAPATGGARQGRETMSIPVRPPRAKQSIAPAMRRAVLRRQQGRCAVPGCRFHGQLDLHHLRYRTEGSDSPEDFIGLCPIHHRRVHDGLLLIGGEVSAGLEFQHADGTAYGRGASAPALRVREQAFSILVNAGLRPRHVKRVLAELVPHVGAAASLEEVVRAALARLT